MTQDETRRRPRGVGEVSDRRCEARSGLFDGEACRVHAWSEPPEFRTFQRDCPSWDRATGLLGQPAPSHHPRSVLRHRGIWLSAAGWSGRRSWARAA